MSYGPPPPRTRYGDQDFIKEDGLLGGPPSASGLPSGPAPPHNQPYAAQYATQAGSYPPPAQTPPLHGYGQPQPSDDRQLAAKELAAATYNLTPEDQIFMQSWRRDSFYQRVFPMSVIFNSAYYYYNHTRQLPHKVLPYLLITSSAYLLGKWSFKDELKRRVEASPLQTQFMTSLRTLMGVQSPASAMGEFSSDISQDYTGAGFGSSLAPPLPPTSVNSAYTRRGPPTSGSNGGGSSGGFGGVPPYSSGLPDSRMYPDTLGGSSFVPADSDGVPLPTTSYDELRARNRGLIQK